MTLTMLPHKLPCYQYDGWCSLSNAKTKLKHGFFTAAGGISHGVYNSLNCGYGSNDDPACIDENRRRVATGLGFAPNKLFGLRQYHSATAVLLPETAHSARDQRPDADAFVTTKRDVALAILTADCVPVLFADHDNGVIGAAHAGWRGAHSGILGSTINLMRDNGATLANIEAVIGPAIAKSSYQVGDDCRDVIVTASPDARQFFTVDTNASQKYFFDLPAFTEWQIRRIGLTKITDLAIDTYDDANNLFSHRRASHAQLPDTGRQIAVIGLTS